MENKQIDKSKTMNAVYTPLFNYIEEETDSGYETIQDFYLSWMLRWAVGKYKEQNSRLHEFGRNAVYFLLYGVNKVDVGFCLDSRPDDDFHVISVKTKRQSNRIDLIAEIEIEAKPYNKKYVFNIEDKWYTNVKDKQLEDAKKILNSKKYRGCSIKNFVIFYDENVLNKKREICTKHGYFYLTTENIASYAGLKSQGRTGNALFDEYWYGLVCGNR